MKLIAALILTALGNLMLTGIELPTFKDHLTFFIIFIAGWFFHSACVEAAKKGPH